MANILAGAFRGLSKALNIQGGKGAPTEIDLSQLTPVLDLTGFARANSGGNFTIGVLDAHVAVGNIQTIIDPWDPSTFTADNGFEVDQDDELVIYGAGGTSDDTADFEQANIGVAWATTQRGATGPVLGQIDIVFRCTSMLNAMLLNGATAEAPLIPTTASENPKPYIMRFGQVLSFRSDSDTAGTVGITYGVSVLKRSRWYGSGVA